jgi:putative acetyltransferase
MLTVRPETPSDYAAVRRVHDEAFAPLTQVGAFVDALRADPAYRPKLSLLAVKDGAVVGHVAYSEARLDTGGVVLVLAPLAVLPAHQGQGVGGALVRESLALATATDYPAVVLHGHPAYYPRFGFQPAVDIGLRSSSGEGAPWMAHPLPARRGDAQGVVSQADVFALLD